MKHGLRVLSICAIGACPPIWAADDAGSKQAPEVVVTATPLRESPLETAQPTEVISGDVLVRLRSLSLGETLAAQPGISATYFGPQASRPIIRGLGGERVQMYEDGGEALDVSALSNDHSVTIDPLLAERIEVVRGPATLLYGNGASGGLINVVTNRVPSRVADAPLSGALELRGDSAMDERGVSGRLDGGKGAFAWHADAFTRETDDVSIPGFALSRALREQLALEGEEIDAQRGTLANSASDSRGGALGASFVGERGFAGFAVSRFETDYGIVTSHEHEHGHDEEDGEEEHEGEEGGPTIDLKQTRYDFDAELRDPFAGLLAMRLRASYNEYEHGEIEADGTVGTLFDQQGLDTRLVFDHAPLAGWRGTFGIQYRDIDLEVTGEEALLPAAQTRNVGYFFFEEKPFGSVTLELGARLETQRVEAQSAEALPRYDKTSVSASAGALWKATPNYTLALNLTSTQRHPTATELYANGPHLAADRFEVGDPGLRRERANTVDIGLRRVAGEWRGALTAFHSEYSHYIFPELTGEEQDGLALAQYRQADARFTGFEAELSLPPVTLPAGTLSTRLMADYVRAKLKDGGNLPQIPPLRAGFEIGLERGSLLSSVSVMYHDTQDKTALNELPTDSYTLVDIDISYRMPAGASSMLLFVRGQNLLDEEARRHASPLKDRAPLPGRGAAAGVRIEF